MWRVRRPLRLDDAAGPENDRSRRGHRDGSTLHEAGSPRQQLNLSRIRLVWSGVYSARLIEKITRPSDFWVEVKAFVTIGSLEPTEVPT